MEENPLKWLSIIEGVLFAHCVRKYSSTKYSPFKLLSNRAPVLPIDVKYKLSSTENSDPDESFSKDVFDTVLASSNVIREETHRQVGENIKRSQKKQRCDYESRNKYSASNDSYIGAEVLLRNKTRKDRRGRKLIFRWLGSYVVSDITEKSLVTLKNKNEKEPKKIYNQAHLKLFFENWMVSTNIKIIHKTKMINTPRSRRGHEYTVNILI